MAASGSLISAFCVMQYSSPLAIVTNVFSLSILSVMCFSANTSLIVSVFLTVCSVGSSCVFMFLDMIKRKKNVQEKEHRRPFYVKVLMVSVVVVITILFFLMYQTSNPLFKDFTKNINLDFISAPWIFFTLGGLMLLYGFFYNRHLGILTSSELSISNELDQERAIAAGFLNRLFKEDTEFLTGVILFTVLNVMLLVLNALDLNYLWFDGKLPEGMQHKEFVHDGVGALISSIIFAILIILYIFRGRLNYNPKSKALKMLAYVWIIQNAFMIFSTAYRMNMYISESGISYKKIGVYVYLGLTLVGLVTTYIKVSKHKSNWFLFRTNPIVYYSIMVISSTINWDVFITRFNIDKAVNENKKLEKYYLADLSFKNIPDLLKLNDSIQSYDDYDARDYYFSSRGTYFYNFKSGLDKKLYSFLKDYNQYTNWQSWCSEKERVFNEVKELNEREIIKTMQLGNDYSIVTLAPISGITNLIELNLENSQFRMLPELASFKRLQKLNLRNNQIDSLDKFPTLPLLLELDLSGNPVTGLQALKNSEALLKLNLQGSSMHDLSALPRFSKLQNLNISSNAISDFNELGKYKELQELSIGSTFVGRLDSFPVLTSLTALDVSSNQIKPVYAKLILDQLKHCSKLIRLNLSNNELSNFYDFIDGNTEQGIFPELNRLEIQSNKIHTLAGIGVLTQLRELYISGNEIKDIAPLFNLRNLHTLVIDANPINSIEGISQMKNLELLNLSGCKLRTGFTELAGLKMLNNLNVTANSISNIQPFTALPELKYLNLTDNNIKSLNGIEKLSNLEELYLTGNNIKDVSPLMALKKLKTLYLNKISEADMKKLKSALPDCKIDDSNYGNTPQAAEVN